MNIITKSAITTTLIACGQSLFAQANTYSATGTIVDKSGKPIEAAHVVALSQSDSTFVVGVLSDREGRFNIQGVSKPFFLSVKCMGYKSLMLPVEGGMQRITLDENATELSELVVLSSYIKRKPSGELSVKVHGNPIAKGKAMLETLRYVQGVEVYNENILINGKDDTQIYLGDRKITAKELQSIPSSMIKSVEVVPNAGVSFGKDAKGGVIKLTLRETEGLIGNVDLSAQADKEGFVELLLSSALQYQRGKFGLYNNFKTGIGDYRTRYARLDKYSSSQTFSRQSNIDKDAEALVENLSISYQPTPSQTILLYGGLTLMNDNIKQESFTNTLPSLRQDTDRDFRETNIGANYKTKVGIGKSSSFSTKVEYLSQKNSDDIRYTLGVSHPSLLEQRFSLIKVEPNLQLGLGKENIKLGLIYDYLRDDNQKGGISNPLLSNLTRQDFLISGGDIAPWVEYSRMIGTRMYIQAGLSYQETRMRYEDRLITSADYQVKHSGLYPNLQVQYVLSPKTQSGLSLAYRRDFSLPNYGYYNPIPIYQNEKLYSIGNQQLKPELFHTIEANYYINPRWVLTYRLRSGRDMIHLLSHQDSADPQLVYTRPENVGKLLQHYASLSYTHSIGGFWQTNNRLFTRLQRETMPGREMSSSSLGWSATQQFRLRKNAGITLSFAGNTGEKHLSYETGLIYSVDLGAYISLMSNRLNIKLSSVNLLHSKDEMRVKTDFADMLRTNLSPRRRIKLSLTWNFSTGDKLKKRSASMVSAPSRETPTL